MTITVEEIRVGITKIQSIIRRMNDKMLGITQLDMEIQVMIKVTLVKLTINLIISHIGLNVIRRVIPQLMHN